MNIKMMITSMTLTTLLGCSGLNQDGSATADSNLLHSFPAAGSGGNLRLSLTDAPSRELKNVFVNVAHAELFIRTSVGPGRVIVARDLGPVDLLTLRNGVLLPMEDLQLSSGTEVTAIRLVLRGDNNHSIKSDDSLCPMQTPSGQQSGIKIKLAQPFTIDENYVYSMVLDFDAEKSVVIKGNGDCLLKPVLKLMNVTRTTFIRPDDNSGDDSNVDDKTIILEPVTDGTDTNDGSDFEIPLDPVDEPPVITAP